MLNPTLDKAGSVADTSELFMRSAKLLELSLVSSGVGAPIDPVGPTSVTGNTGPRPIQPLVQSLMKTLLEDHPGLLDDDERGKLMNRDYCKNLLGLLQIGNLALLRRAEAGREVSGRSRYWKRLYGEQFYVCSQWWKYHHLTNAERLLQFVSRLAQSNTSHPGVTALERHEGALLEYIGRARA